jgi:hypothetical protein
MMNMKLPQEKFSTFAPGDVLGSSELSMSEGHAHNEPHLSAGHALDTGARPDLLEQYSLWSSCRGSGTYASRPCKLPDRTETIDG